MNRIWLVCLGVILLSSVSLAAEEAKFRNEMDRINYSIGYQIGGDFQRQGWKINPDLLIRGMSDAMSDRTPLLSEEQMNATLKNMKKKLLADQKMTAKKADALFLAENAKKEGVIVLPSGVQYKIIKEGKGKQPTLNDSVSIRYKVKRPGGKDVATGDPWTEPKTYSLKKAIPGLQEALQLMKEGAVWQIVLPPGPTMGMRSETMETVGVLIYELELISVKPDENPHSR